MEVPLSNNRSRRSFRQVIREASVRLAFSPLNSESRDSKDDREFESGDEEYRSLSKRRGADFWKKKRQMFVHSYRFTTKKSVPERVEASLRKLKAATRTIVPCKCSDISLASGKKMVPERMKASLQKLKAATRTILASKCPDISLASRLKRFDCCSVGSKEYRN